MSEEESKENIIKTPDLEYGLHKYVHTNPRWTVIRSQNAADFTTTSVSTGSGLYELIIPSSVFSLAKSRLNFTVSVNPADTQYACMSLNAGSYISRVSISTLSGSLLCDISNFNKLSQIILPISTSQEEINSYHQGLPTSTAAGALATTTIPTSTTVALATTASKSTPYGALSRSDIGFTAAAGGLIPNVIGDVTRHPVQHTGLRQFGYNTTVGATVMSAVTFDVSLGELFKHTIMSVDKLLYFGGESLSLQIYYADANQFSFYPTTIPTSDPGGTYVTAGHSIVYSAPTLYLKQEMNLDLARSVMERCNNKGLQLPFSYLYGSKQTFTASSQQTVQQTINSSLGSSLMWVASSPFDNTDSAAGFNSNAIIPILRNAITATQLNSYNSFIDSIPIASPSGFDVTVGDHYRANQDNFEGSASPLSLTEYGYNFVHIDNFTGLSMSKLGGNSQTHGNGMSLGANRVWSLQAQWNASIAKVWYTFWSCQRLLVIKDGRVSVM